MQQPISSKARILVVDDQKLNLTILRDLLLDQGEIILAKSGAQAIEKASRLTPDLILLDVVMPEMDGFETFERIKKIQHLSDVPVIFITGLKDTDHEQKGLVLGALDYIRKPFTPTVVRSRVTTHLKLVRQNKQLKSLSLCLQEADAAKSRFLAHISHEIRTPLTSIIGYADLLKEGELDLSEHDRAVSSIAINGEHLLHLVNDILDMSKIEANQLALEIMPVALPRWLSNIIDIVVQRATEKNLEFNVNLQFPLPEKIQTDPTRLQQVLLNLLNNAIKFTSVGYVALDVKVDQQNLVFVVTDTGVGIDAAQQSKIFDAFSQAEISTSRKYGGTGLGLNISQHLAQHLGGRIEVLSEPGRGSQFSASVAMNLLESTSWIQDIENWNASVNENKIKVANPELKGRILVAEDQTEISHLISVLLKDAGLDAVLVSNGHDLVECAKNSQFDLILTDIQMPTLSGTAALAELQRLGIATPAIALTANAMVHQTDSYKAAGFSDFICKPFNRVRFLEVIERNLAKSQDAQDDDTSDHLEGMSAETFIRKLPDKMLLLQGAVLNQQWQDVARFAEVVEMEAASFGFDVIEKNIKRLIEAVQKLHLESGKVTEQTESAAELMGDDTSTAEIISDIIDELYSEVFALCQGYQAK